MIFGIDPGPRYSAFVRMGRNKDGLVVVAHDHLPNDHMLQRLRHLNGHDEVAIEMIASYGMPVGREVFETCVWIGRFVEARSWASSNYQYEGGTHLITRAHVKMAICNSMKAKDGNIRQALIDMFPPVGGGKVPQIGVKKQPGPLYGMASHKWSALAVAVTFDKQQAAE